MKSRLRGSGLLAALSIAFASPQAAGQPYGISGYLQTVPVLSTTRSYSDTDAALFNRLRIAAEPKFGEVSVSAAYELAAAFFQGGVAEAAIASGIGRSEESSDRLDLQSNIARDEQFFAQHRVDRLFLSWAPSNSSELSLGRQAISWGTTFFLTPADPFVPFGPADVFREFRRGIDAVRLRNYPGPLSELDVVIRPSRFGGRQELTALARGLTTWNDWEVSAWGGQLYGHAAAALGAAGSVGEWGVRFEGISRDYGGSFGGRVAISVDRSMQVFDRDLRIVLEYQRDDRGAAQPADYRRILTSDEFLRGEIQALGRDEFAIQAAYQIHPLWNVSALALWNLNNSSAILSPGFTYSLSNDVTVVGGVYLGLGDRIPKQFVPPDSENTTPGVTGYVSLTRYF